MRTALLAALVLALGSPVAHAAVAPGAVTFDAFRDPPVEGVYPTGLPFAVSLLDGSTVLGGGERGAVLVRLEADGSLDAAFGDQGIARSVPNELNSRSKVTDPEVTPVALLRRDDGGFLLVGRVCCAYAASTPAGLPRLAEIFAFTAGGRPDASFNGGLPAQTPLDVATASLAPDGSILLTGSLPRAPARRGGPSRTFSVAKRVLTDGSIDRAFGAGGIVHLAQGSHISGAYSAAPAAAASLPDESLVVSMGSLGGRAVLRRIRMDGSVDPSFTPTAGWRGGIAVVSTDDGVLWVGRLARSGLVQVLRVSSAGVIIGRFTLPSAVGRFGAPVGDGQGGLLFAEPVIADDPRPPAAVRVRLTRVSADGHLRSTVTALPFAGGSLGFGPPTIRQSVFRLNGAIVRPDGHVLVSGVVAGIQHTNTEDFNQGHSERQAAVVAIDLGGSLDPAFGGPRAPARATVTVGVRAPRVARQYGLLELDVGLSSPGLARFTVAVDAMRAVSTTSVMSAGASRIDVPLSARTPRALLPGRPHRISVTMTFRDFLGVTVQARATGILG